MTSAKHACSRSVHMATRLLLAMCVGVAALPVAGVTMACAAEAAAQSVAPDPTPTHPGEDLRVWLVTAGPGDEVWERYGHNALRVLNTRTGRDVSYNWGIFAFNQVDFIPRFLQGRMLYRMAAFETTAMVNMYAQAEREVLLQELDLSPAQKFELQTLADINALPENRQYIYQYFLDNCSTRIRDLLDRVLGGALQRQFGSVATGTSYRDHTRRLTQIDPLIFAGMDLLLGTPTDVELTVWEEMFLPLTLRDELRKASIVGEDGTARPLVSAEEVVVEASRAKAGEVGSVWLVLALALGLGLGAVFASFGSRRVQESALLRRSVVTVAVSSSALGGVLGLILVLLLFTDHTFAYWNENLFLFNPLLLGLAVMLPLSSARPAWRHRAGMLAAVVAGVALLGLVWQVVPASQQPNAMFFAVAVPAHLGLAWGLLARHSDDPATA
jgi:uncharacterized protein DUF4105